jgi:thioredoxin reductase (NADPH)
MASIFDVAIVGGGVAGRTAGLFTARNGLETLLVDAGSSILRRNAHLENYPGFPAGVDARWLLETMREQGERAGCAFERAEVTSVTVTGDTRADTRFTVETAESGTYRSRFVIAATKNAVEPFERLPCVDVVDRGKSFVDVTDGGRTDCDGFYAAGRLAGKPHQTVVAAGHGAEVALAVLEDADRPFYHDWVVPEGYFTGRGREVPPGCEEIDDAERRRRDADARSTMRSRLEDSHPERPEQHPSVEES